jgi:Glycosyl transferase family 11
MKRETLWLVAVVVVSVVVIVVGILAFRYRHVAQTHASLLQAGTRDTRPPASVVLRNGFGNQLFEVAALLGYAERHGLQPLLDLEKVSVNAYAHTKTLTTDWYHDIVVDSLPVEHRVVKEAGHSTEYTPLHADADAPAVLLDGWFQSPKYFPAPAVLRRHIHPPQALVDEVRARWPVADDPRAVAMHIRRGDYALIAKKMLLDTKEDYYQRALAAMAERIGATPDAPAPLAVFSDDIDWCRSFFMRFPQPCYTLVYVRDQRDVHELALMAQFKHHILSNSTFGWWGAVLADSQDVYAPYPWDALSDSKDVYMGHWTLL